MPSDDAYLEDMHNAANRVARFIEGLSREQFLEDEKTQSAVIRQIEVMGEAANHVNEEFCSAHPEISWKELARLRNFYIHAYRGVQAEKVWQTARGLVRKTQQQVASLLPPIEDGD